MAPPDARVAALAAFQTKALLHALSFPSAERVSYSTCSVHALENERVVKTVAPRALELGYTLEKALPAWHRRGLESESAGLEAIGGAECLVRADQRRGRLRGFLRRRVREAAAAGRGGARGGREGEARGGGGGGAGETRSESGEEARAERRQRGRRRRRRGAGGGGGGKKKKKKKGAKSKPGRLFK